MGTVKLLKEVSILRETECKSQHGKSTLSIANCPDYPQSQLAANVIHPLICHDTLLYKIGCATVNFTSGYYFNVS